MRGLLKSRILLIVVAVGACLVLMVGVANAVVLFGDGGKLKHAQVALVLGAGLDPDGSPSSMLRDRIDVAADLYEDGRVDKILVSGDHGTIEYDEVNTMRKSLLARGVPDSKIYTDHAGFDTWDSMVRAKKVFKVDSAIVVTQGFHLPRAVWLAKRAGLRVGGVSATAGGYGRQGKIGSAREVLARVKAVEQVVTGADPKFLGKPVPIDGPASKSRG
jgi:SanA protein